MAKVSEIKEEIHIPEQVDAQLAGQQLTIKSEKGELTRVFANPTVSMTLKDKVLVIQCKQHRRKQKALVGTFAAHINNMIRGVTIGFEYHMKTVFSHFPIKLSVEGDTFVIQNFLGERAPRHACILSDVNVKIDGDEVIVTGIDKEKVGQTVANIERATKVKRRDIRVFQDGVYRTSRGGS